MCYFDFPIQNANLDTRTEGKIHTSRHSLSEKLFAYNIILYPTGCVTYFHMFIQTCYTSISSICKECLVDGNSEANIFIFSPYCFCIDIGKSKTFLFLFYISKPNWCGWCECTSPSRTTSIWNLTAFGV